MEDYRYVLPSNAYSLLSPMEAPKSRLPLMDSTGNAQYHTMGSANNGNGQKGLETQPPPGFLLPTLPSQPPRPLLRTSLEKHKSHIRSQKTHKLLKMNLILESELYQAYRSRQPKEGSKKDQMWPDDLEDLFLEALCYLPPMGKRKFSINGKPRGRNELICRWLWIGYCESLQPGQQPDESQRRARKQVSSHLQVLKNFMRNHPAFRLLFPLPPHKNAPSLKYDPTLIALMEGRLPHRRSSHHESGSLVELEVPDSSSVLTKQTILYANQQGRHSRLQHQSLRPSLFKMYMTTLRPGVEFKDVPEDDAGDGELSTRVHTYSDSIPHKLRSSQLETLPSWRSKFPVLAQIQSKNELDCDIIHIEVSLKLHYGSLPERSELWGRFHILLPGECDREISWRCKQSLHKPADLYGPPNADYRFENVVSTPIIDSYESNVGTHLRISFPALSWAHALQRLSTINAHFEEARQSGTPISMPTTARQYIDQITMFQEISSCIGPSQSFNRKAIILWTFRKCKDGEECLTTWRYLTPPPPRESCFSPHPGTAHVMSAAMNGTLAAWADHTDTSSILLPPLTGTDSFGPLSPFDDLPTPSMQSVIGNSNSHFAFSTYDYLSAPTENVTFASQDTQDSDSPHVDLQSGVGSSSAISMDNFLPSSAVLASFDQSVNLWETPNPIQDFESDPAFLADYAAVSSNEGSHFWN